MKYLILTTATASAPVLLKNADKTNQVDVVVLTFVVACVFAMISVLLSEWRSPFFRFAEVITWLVFMYLGSDFIRKLWSADKDSFIALCLGMIFFFFVERIVTRISGSFLGIEPDLEKAFNYVKSKLKNFRK